MITSKRDLKKYIGEINDAVVQYVLPLAALAGDVNDEQADGVLAKLAELHNEASKRINISYDKKPSAFATISEYKNAKREYFKQAYGKALDEYKAGVNAVLDVINKAAKK